MNAALKAAAAGGLRRSGLLRMLRAARPQTGPAVLMLHRVLPRAQQHLCYDPHLVMREDLFAALLELLAGAYQVVSLAELLAEKNPRAVALTFDDAWEDTCRVAFPLLRKFGMPATVFLCPALMEQAANGAMLPEERLARVWEHTSADKRARLLDSLEKATGERPRARKAAGEALKRVPMDDKLWLLAQWEQDFAVPAPASRSLMVWDEARALSNAGITLGSHTLRHCTLTAENAGVVTDELTRSREALTRATGHAPQFLAYPNGAHNALAREAARAAGYTHAFTTAPGFVSPAADPFALPRLPMEDAMVAGGRGTFHASRALLYLQLLR